MRVNPQIAGRVYPPSPAYEVSRIKIQEFAEAINSWDPVHRDADAARAQGYPDVIAPPTFAVIVSQRCDAQVILDPDAGIDYSRVVHGEQSFVHHRPIVAGDRLVATLNVDDVNTRGKHAMVTTRVEIADGRGEPVATARSTVVVRGGGQTAEEGGQSA
jgi:acyl dehydratase